MVCDLHLNPIEKRNKNFISEKVKEFNHFIHYCFIHSAKKPTDFETQKTNFELKKQKFLDMYRCYLTFIIQFQ